MARSASAASDCAADAISVAAVATPLRLRPISLVVAVCSSIAEAMVAWMSLIRPITVAIPAMAVTAAPVSAWSASTRLMMSSVAFAVS